MNYSFMILIKILFDKPLFIASTKETFPNRVVGYSVISLAVCACFQQNTLLVLNFAGLYFAFFAIVKNITKLKSHGNKSL